MLLNLILLVMAFQRKDTHKEVYTFFREEIIRDYIRGANPNNTRIEEFLAAVTMANVFKKGSQCEFLIGFKIKAKYNLGPKKEIKNIKFSELDKILQFHIEEDTEVDFVISPMKENSLFPEEYVYAFQMKLFGQLKVGDRGTKELIEYINKVSLKYAPCVCVLLIVFQSHTGIDIHEMNKLIGSIKNLPFPKVMFMGNNTTKKYLQVGEFWPEMGYWELDPKYIFDL